MYVLIKQVSKHKWRIETTKGIVLVDELILDNPNQADEYARCYVSSFTGWMYEVVPLEEI